MQKKILAAIGAAMLLAAVGLTGCSGEDGQTSSVASVASSEASSTVESETPSSNTSEEPQESGVTASELEAAFEEKFAANPIDEAYNQQIDNVGTNQEIMSLASTYAGLWNAEISHAYEELIQNQTCGNGLDEVKADQKKWEQEKDAKIAEIRDSISGDGSTVQMERAVKIKDFYREKAKELYSQLYACDPDYDYIYTPY